MTRVQKTVGTIAQHLKRIKVKPVPVFHQSLTNDKKYGRNDG